MFTLTNSQLSVSIINPNVDLHHLGSRYCTGGYIWQVSDSQNRDLLSGPQYPQTFPSPYDGQGAPEAFVTPLGEDFGRCDDRVTIIGVGTVVRSVEGTPFNARFNPVVEKFCDWNIELIMDCVKMETSQQQGVHSCHLVRKVLLMHNTIISTTEITNTSKAFMPLRWFPHPFFPLNHDYKCGKLNFECGCRANDGYMIGADSVLSMKRAYDWKKGLFFKLDISSQQPFSADIDHPHVSVLSVKTTYRPDELPIWANSATFSFEPYLIRVLPPGECMTWQVLYTFGDKG